MRWFHLLAPLALVAGLPASGAGFPCPAGWAHEANGCDTAACLAPMGTGLIQIDRFTVVAGRDDALASALDGYEQVIAADGTPLHDLLGEAALQVDGRPALRRDYAGSALGRDLRIALVLVRVGTHDLVARAVWEAQQGALFDHLVTAAVAAWAPATP